MYVSHSEDGFKEMCCASLQMREGLILIYGMLRNVDLALLYLLINNLMLLFYFELCLYVCALLSFKGGGGVMSETNKI